MSVGKVMVGNIRVKEQNDFIIHILNPASIESLFFSRPVGSALLWLDENRAAQTKKCPLSVSFKYKNTIVHHVYEKFIFFVQFGRNNQPKCKTNPKMYRQICDLNMKFLPVLRLFIAEFSQNRNFIEKDFDADPDLEKELVYRRFVIYPSKERIMIKRKVGKDILSANVSIDFQNGAFWSEITEKGLVKQIRSFNEFLLEFLEVDTTDKLRVKAALGYQDDLDLYTGKRKGALLEVKADALSPSENDEALTIVSEKEKKKLMSDLEQALQASSKEKHWAVIPNNIHYFLRQIYASTHILQQEFEKNDWIQRGVLEKMLLVMERNSDEKQNELPVKICECLLTDNPSGAHQFCSLAFSHIERNINNLGVFSIFVEMTKAESFVYTFVKKLGYPRFLDVYINASILLLGDQSKEFGEFLEMDEGMSRLDEEVLGMEKIDSETEDDKSDGEGAAAVAMLSPGRPVIPKIKVPLLGIKAEQATPGGIAKSTRYARRELSARGLVKSKLRDFQQSSIDQLDQIARVLGESYVTIDLAEVLSLKPIDDEQIRDIAIPAALNDLDAEGEEGEKDRAGGGIRAWDTNYYKIKCLVLKTLSNVSAHPKFFRNYRNPVNLFFTELLISHKDGLLSFDNDLRQLIYQVLSNFSDHVEYIHRIGWRRMTQGMSLLQRRNYRYGMDKFLWRVYNRMVPAVVHNDRAEWDLQLTLLGEYMQNCPNRILSEQVVDLCMEQILQVLQTVISYRISADFLEFASTAHLLLIVLDEIVLQSRHGALDEYLVSLFLDREDVFRYFKTYTGQIWLSKEISQIYHEEDKTDDLNKYRLRTAEHWKTLLKLIHRLAVRYKKMDSVEGEQREKKMCEYLNKLNFLISPLDGGYFWQIIASKNIESFPFVLRHSLMTFFSELFSYEGSPYLRWKVYTDQYIGFHYINFVKLYNNPYADSETLELCRLNLEVLLRFAVIRTDDIVRKFYQLCCIDFLVQEVSLEQEITAKHVPKEIVAAEGSDMESDWPLSLSEMRDLYSMDAVTPKSLRKRRASIKRASGMSTTRLLAAKKESFENQSNINNTRKRSLTAETGRKGVLSKSVTAVTGVLKKDKKPLSPTEKDRKKDNGKAKGLPGKMVIKGLSLTSEMTRDGQAVKGKDVVLSPGSPSDTSEPDRSLSRTPSTGRGQLSPTSSKGPIRLPGLSLTARDGQAVKGKDVIVGGQSSESSSSSNSNSSSSEDEPVKPKTTFKLPGLSLPSEVTVDGVAVQGKGVVIGKESESGSGSGSESGSSSGSGSGSERESGTGSDSEKEQEETPVKKAPFKLPGLSLTSEMTVDGKAVQGKGVVIGENKESSGEDSEEGSDAESASGPGSGSGSESSSEEIEEAPKRTPFKMPGLSLTSEMTVDGKAVKGKDIVVGGGKGAESDTGSGSGSGSGSEGISGSGSGSGSGSSSEREPAVKKKGISLPGLSLTSEMTRDGQAVQGKGIVVGGEKKSSGSDRSVSASATNSDGSDEEGESKKKKRKRKEAEEEEQDFFSP